MADAAIDPYAGARTEKERQAVYRGLQAQHKKDLEIWEHSEGERRKAVYDEQMKIWHHLHTAQREYDGRFHRSALTVAAGAFGVSFAFINQLVPIGAAIGMPVLVAAWVLFGISIVVALLELKIESVVHDALLDIVEENIQRGYDGKPYKEAARWKVMVPTRVMSWTAFGTFLLGVACLLYFVGLNTIPA